VQHRPLLAVGILGALSIFLTSAKCIENDSVGRDPGTGDWAIYGEIHNETDIQGVDLRLRGELFDADGNLVAAAVDSMCPRELSPGSLSAFAIRLPVTAALPQPADHKVTVVDGRALDEPLPKLNITSSASFAQQLNDVFVLTIKYSANQPYDAPLSACVAIYDASDNVVRLFQFGGSFSLEPAKVEVESTFINQMSPRFVPTEATRIRYWLWLQSPIDALASDHHAFVSDLIAIQRPPQFERR
jgi:hypothetical protein